MSVRDILFRITSGLIINHSFQLPLNKTYHSPILTLAKSTVAVLLQRSRNVSIPYHPLQQARNPPRSQLYPVRQQVLALTHFLNPLQNCGPNKAEGVPQKWQIMGDIPISRESKNKSYHYRAHKKGYQWLWLPYRLL